MDTARRKKIGILFIFKSRWLGGLYYILNVISSCAYLPENDQPEIILFYNRRTKKYLEAITYNKITLVEIDVDFSLKIYLKSLILNKNLFFANEFTKHNLDVIFPFNDFVGAIKSNNIKLVSWIPDFQHKFYPEYFGKLALFLRELKFRGIVSGSDGLVLSSNAALDDFKQFYRPKKSFKVDVVRFTSIIDTSELYSREVIKKRYEVTQNYFIVCNQFSPHKNHFIVLKALKLLNQAGEKVTVYITGQPVGKSEIEFVKEMEQYIDANHLDVRFLGLLSRVDQLSLMNNAISIIQPSKFEGWSTVIEDAKTLQKFVIASKLDVHVEQLGEKGLFFDPDNAVDLANCMIKVINMNSTENLWEPLVKRTKTFAGDFLNALN